MTSYEFPTRAARLSDAERENALALLRDGAAEGRLSHDTFLRRMELVLTAQVREELDALVVDVKEEPEESRFSRLFFGTVAKVSGFSGRLRRAWTVERLPGMMLPEPGQYPLRIGRAPECGLRLNDGSASRYHAELRREGDAWVLRDLGSTNGTWVNGRRVMGAVTVRPGDQVAFGPMSYRLEGR